MKAAVKKISDHPDTEHPSLKAAIEHRTATMNSTHQAISIRRTFDAWEEQNNRLYALVAAVRKSLMQDDAHFNELQLLDIGLDMLGDLNDMNYLKKALGVSA